MGYSIFKFGSLYLEGVARNIPENPMEYGDISSHKIMPNMHPKQTARCLSAQHQERTKRSSHG